MKKTLLLTIASLTLSLGALAYDYTDDIYYNPKKPASSQSASSKKKVSNYVDFSTIDVDEYNKRGQYYYSPVDTIGTYMESEPDFVYTTQIQKYYNPTIVTDNANLIRDVLDNSYGNVEIVYNYNGTPSFVPLTYSYPYAWAYSTAWYNPWSWSFNFGPFGWSVGWNSWWNWGPSWSWGPSWAWNWGPSWGWGPGWGWGGPGWGPGWRPGPGGPAGPPPRPMATHSPGGLAPFGGSHASVGRPNTGNFNGAQGVAGGGTTKPATPPRRQQSAPTIQHGNNVSTAKPTTPQFGTNGRQPGTSATSRPSLNGLPTTGTTTRPTTTTTTTTRPQTTNSSGRTPSTTNSQKATQSTTRKPTTTTTNKQSTTTTSRPSTTTTSRPSSVSPSRTPSSGAGGFGGRSGGSTGGGRSGGGRR